MFTDLENNKPFLKMAFQGFAGDGKTLTSSLIAIGLHKLINSQKPIALFDTEKAFKALKPLFDENNIKAVTTQNRSLAALNKAIKWCEEGNADILIIDSITHVWEEFKSNYMKNKRKNNSFLEFQDWGILKPRWKDEFSTPFVDAKCHIIFTGRAGYEYEQELNEDTGKREIYKSGLKMKSETETAFEPDILVSMSKHQELLTDDKKIWREATILKDRTREIDGKTFKYTKGDEDRVFPDFYPAIKILLDGTLKEIHGVDIPDTFDEWENRYSVAAKERERMMAEIDGCFGLMGVGGTGAADKQIRAWTLSQVYGVNSVENVVKKSNAEVKKGLRVIQAFANKYKDYLNECLDSENEIDKNKIKEFMKELLTEQKEDNVTAE
jgi:hypothetical protein